MRGVCAILLLVLTACTNGTATAPPNPTGTPGASPGPGATPGASSAPIATTARDVETVRFGGSGPTLAGDLRVPDGHGPHPGIVLVHGSGPSSRDGVLPGQLAMPFPEPVAVLSDLASGLRDAGYAVLTYDKRTCGPFNGCADNGYATPSDDLTIEAFVDDATAAVRYVRSRPEVRSDAVVVAGHSQGASFVPGMLLDDPRLAAGVMLSAPYDPVDGLLTAQAEHVRRVVAERDPAPPGAAQSVAQLQQLARSVTDLRRGGGDDSVMLSGATVGFWRSWLRLGDGVPQLAQQAPQPLLVLTGAADANVGPGQTAQWARTLTSATDEVVELDCVSHALNCLHADDPLASQADEIDANVDARVVQTIAEFLDEALP